MDAGVFWLASFARGADGGNTNATRGILAAPRVCQTEQMGGADVNPLLAVADVCYILNCRFYDAQLTWAQGVKHR